MAGTLVANTINTDTGLFSTNNAYSGIAKAWVSFVGSSGSINNSFNITSVTRNGTGDYTITFATAMPNANYTMAFLLGNGTSQAAGTAWTITLYSTATTSTTSVRVSAGYTSNGATGVFDPNPVTIAFFGN